MDSIRADRVQEINLNQSQCKNQKGHPRPWSVLTFFSLRRREFMYLICGLAVLAEICWGTWPFI